MAHHFQNLTLIKIRIKVSDIKFGDVLSAGKEKAGQMIGKKKPNQLAGEKKNKRVIHIS